MRGPLRQGIAVAALTAGVLLAGASSTSASPGDLDPGFGSHGRASVHPGPDGFNFQEAGSAAGGSAVALGTREHVLGCNPLECYYEYEPVLVRVTPEGIADPSFGDGGILSVPSERGSDYPYNTRALGIQSNGRVVLEGANGSLIAVDPDGSVAWRTAPEVRASRIDVLPDDRILAAGTYYTDVPEPRSGATVRRLLEDGSPDPTFAGGQPVRFGEGEDPAAIPLAVFGRADTGATVVGGTRGGQYDYRWPPTIWQFDGDGSTDEGFSSDGVGAYPRLDPDATNLLSAAAVDAGGNTLVGGFKVKFADSGSVYTIQRIKPNGERDSTFGGDGEISWHVSGPLRERTYLRDIETLPDGRILLVLGDGNYSTRLEMLSPDGSADESFGLARGAVTIPSMAGARVAAVDSSRVTLAGQYKDRVLFAAVSLEPGVANADADPLPDSADRCDEIYSERSSGCPKIGREVRLEYVRVLKGTYLSAFTKGQQKQLDCGRVGTVRIQRLTPEGRETVARVQASERLRDRRTPIPQLDGKKGRFTATMRSTDVSFLGTCERARSETLLLKG